MTTTAGSTCSSPMAPVSPIPCPRARCPTSPTGSIGTGCTGKLPMERLKTSRRPQGSQACPRSLYSMGVAVGDFDNDGFTDLFVTGYGGNTLYRNSGNGTFIDVTGKAGVRGSGWSSSAGFFDYDNDGRLDLVVGRYVEWNFQANRYCGAAKPGGRAYCHPDNFNGVTNILYHNNGDGTFTDVSAKAGIANPLGKALGCRNRRLRCRRLDRHLCRQRFRPVLPVPQQQERDVYGEVLAVGYRLQRGWENLCRHGHRLRRL